MKTILKIILEVVAMFILTFILSSEYIFIANAYSIPCLSWFFILAYFLCCWLCHRACGMQKTRSGIAISILVGIVTFFSVEEILHKDEKQCQNWILKVIESASNSRLQNESEAFSGKERSFDIAMKILREHNDIAVFDKIRACNDVDALRIIVYAASAAAWDMEAGPDVAFDFALHEIALGAIHRLFVINSQKSRDAIDGYKQAFCVDGIISMLFKEWQEESRALRSKCNSNQNDEKSAVISPERGRP